MSNFNLRTMKTGRLLKITLSIAVLAFMSGNVFGQSTLELSDGTTPGTDLSEAPGDGSVVDHVTEGYRVPYDVTPDDVLNSSFSEPYVIGTQDQSFNSGWNWDFNTNNTVGDGAANATIYNGGYDDDNSAEYGYNHPYVEVEWTRSGGATAGSGEQAYIEVQETSQSGSCNGSWNWLSVQVYAAPEFTFTDGSNGGTDQETADASGVIELCDGGGGITRDILIANIPDNGIPIAAGETFENGNFKFRLDKDVAILDGGGGVVSTEGTSIDSIATVSMEFGNGIVLHSGHDLGTLTDGGEAQITRYRFDFGTTIDGLTSTNNGITDPVQRKSQYLTNPDATDADWDYIANTGGNADMLTIITYPAPETGNIHYVPNNFDQ